MHSHGADECLLRRKARYVLLVACNHYDALLSISF